MDAVLLRRHNTGATLVEAAVTLFAAALLLTLGIPGLVAFARNAARDAVVADIVASLNYARGEAIRRGYRITLCPSSDGAGCMANSEWDSGWIVFADHNSNGVVDAGESILQAIEHAPVDLTIRSVKRKLTYQSTGFCLGHNDTLRVCDARGVTEARSVVVSMQGRVRVAMSTATCP